MRNERARFEGWASETGFHPAGLEKVVRLGAVAGAIGTHEPLASSLLLKGGTALNLTLGPPERLSVDLDFNFVGAVERDRMTADRPRIERALEDLARRAGYRVQRSRDAFAGRKLHLGYRSAFGADDRIEIDVNYLLRVPLVAPRIGELWQPGGLDRPRLRIVGTEELVIGKLCALLDRCAARDVWDVARLPPAADEVLRTARFRRLFLILGATLDHPLETYTRARMSARVGPRELERQLAPLLVQGTELRADELIRAAWSKLAALLELDPVEQRFVDRLQEGVSSVELLFPDELEEAARLARHPALIWKARKSDSRRA